MRFRLIYRGPLKATQDRTEEPGKTARRSEHKHKIRQEFHRQLRRLWETDKFLRETNVGVIKKRPGDGLVWGPGEQEKRISLVEGLADEYKAFGYRFVPLARENEYLSCALRILFLRRDPPGAIYNLGDIDNRVKTVLDALRPPKHANQVPGPPADGEDPFFVLLEDDKLVTHLEVETDTLLAPLTTDVDDAALAHLVINVDVRPHYVTVDNSSFL